MAAFIKLASWKKKRGDDILICASSPLLYEFYNTTIDEWLKDTVEKIRKYSNRPITVRQKQLGNIEFDLERSWLLVTHVSASALDALIHGIPVIATAPCAATPMATLIQEIENPRITANRNALFSTLAWGQFTISEMKSGQAWEVVSSRIRGEKSDG